MSNLEKKYKASIKLSAIGDALGWITEFETSTKSLIEKYGVEKIDRFYSWKMKEGGRFYGYFDNIKPGSYSDDTQLLLAVARSIQRDGSLDNNYFAKIELPNWLLYSRGGGRTLKIAAKKIKRKSVTWFNNFYSHKINNEIFDYKQSGANGAAMRILPIALVNYGKFEKIKEEIFCNSLITHGHPRAIIGAILYGIAINNILDYNISNFKWEYFLTQIGQDFHNKFKLNFKNRKEIKEWLYKWNKTSDISFESLYFQTLSESLNALRIIYTSIKHNLSIKSTLEKLGCYNKATKGSGISTVIAAIFLTCKHYNEPVVAILEAVNALGTDTDSIAAFTGGLLGALLGDDIIPEIWDEVQDKNYLEKTALNLLAISNGNNAEINTQYISKLKINQFDNNICSYNIGENIIMVPFGEGKITSIERQPTLVKNRYNLIMEIEFNCGQSIKVSKLINNTQL